MRRSPWFHSTRAALWGAIPAAAVFALYDRASSPRTPALVAEPLPPIVIAHVDASTDAPPAPLASAAAAPLDAGLPFERPTQLIALATWTPVRTEPRRDSQALGYLRAGATVDIVDGPAGRDGCVVHRDHPEGGWYRVRDGGYVCVGGGFAMPAPARGYRAPTQPDLDAAMPYPYAINYGRSIMYRRLPSSADLRVFEPWRFSHATADAGSGGGEMDAGTPVQAAAGTAADPSDTADNRAARRVAEVRDAGGPPRLGDLAGERGGPVVRQLLSGMYVALDRTIRNSSTDEVYWRTQSGGFVRNGRLAAVRNWSRFEGQWLDEAHHLPMAWMVSEAGWEYTPYANGAGASSHRRVPRLTSFALSADPPIRSGAQTFWRTLDGRAVNQRNVRRALLRTPPEGVGPTEKWIDVDLDEQVLVAYEGPRPVFATLISSGRGDRHSGVRNYESPTGSFRIQSRHITTTMDGDTAGDGPYSIEDVPWVMYFHGSYALHGAFWHSYFGWRMSHGCINLSPPDARRVFLWADPVLPAGWHGVYAGTTQPGARVELRHSRANAPEEDRPASAAHAMPVAPAQ